MNDQNLNQYQEPDHKPKYKFWLGLVVFLLILFALYKAIFTEHSIAIDNSWTSLWHSNPAPTEVVDKNYAMPEPEADRLDVLILGIRGEDDSDAKDGGPLLTDSIQVFSYDKKTKKASLISIPRDLYITIYGDKKDKLNTAYEYGMYHSTSGLQFAKNKISQITGVYIDKVVIFDFSAFKEIVDQLGGVDITLDKPFSENQQWGYPFSLPAVPNNLDGQSALYYARSRYSSTDFDRSRRQQQIMMAIKDKILKLNFLSDPVKTFSIFNLIRNDIKTDIGIWDMKQFIDLAHEISGTGLKKYNITTDNLLMDSRINDQYVLLPKSGDLAQIKQFFQDSLK